ncbi:MAG: 4-carboxymuconolactone decarboxylase [Burkholderiales bacterium]|nr:4-carboxymuconolactone decarboxylase [Burkholderiales bacterium]
MTSEVYERGMKARREVLGDAYVDNALRNADELTKPFQDMATEYCWGSVWGRDGLPRKTRSLVNIGMLIALNRGHELEVHLRGAVTNGCTMEEIREVLLQAAVYCGVPAGGEAFRIARKVLSEKS